MFTGLVEGVGRITRVQRLGEDMRLVIEPPFDSAACVPGESVCVDGVCLTVTGLHGGALYMDVSGETLSRSTLGNIRQGSRVNVERALRLSDRLGGHLVSGHVDGVGTIVKMEPAQRSWLIRIGMDERLSRYTVEKGSIAVDGVSLTINRCGEDHVEVNIIPQTGKETTLLKKRVGDPVNIETDMIGKYIERFLLRAHRPPQDKPASGIDGDMLRRHGFGD